MLVSNPVKGAIRPDARYYTDHPLAQRRPRGSTMPLVTQDFGPSTVTVEPTVDWKGGESNIYGRLIAADKYSNFHRAIDISKGGCGADVFAAAPGRVTVSQRNPSGAKIIVVDHGVIDGHRFESGYVHLGRRLVEVGATVKQGTIIGYLGNTGLSSGCHLHFFIKKDGTYVDPWRRLGQNTTIDPDAPAANINLAAAAKEVPDMPIPASDKEYLAGRTALIGNSSVGALIRTAATIDATVIRSIAPTVTETWRPTCWVKGDTAFGSDRWLARWNDGKWEYTHAVNVASVSAPFF